VQTEYFALVSNGLYVEMHDTRRVGRPVHQEIIPSCLTADISYAVYLREELRRWHGLDSEVVREELTVTVKPGRLMCAAASDNT
jgi:hypothetical protein